MFVRVRDVLIGVSVLIGILTLLDSASGARSVDDEIKSPGDPAHQPWIESGLDKGVLARHSKSPDGRHALAWVAVAEPAAIDWELLKSAPDSFYEKYDLRELWVVDLAQNRKLCSLGSSIGYVRPGSHRSLSVAWGPLEGGRRFAIAGYEWKWGTEALLLLDIGSDNCRETQIGQILDGAVGVAVKKSRVQREAYDFKYNISDLPEIGLKTGFANSSTFRIPFTVKSRERDKPVAEGIATLKLTRRADTPSVTVNKVSIEQLREDPFTDDARLAKADRELNALYLDLLKRLKPADQQPLKTDERDWIQQRETEAASLKGDYYDNNRIASDRALQRLTEQRIAELRKRIDSLRKQ
ncbi:MAG TPA: lysozyme inhibitor LprI family protein [Candidatus Udaeobacter sp.]|nr:lysozyme inhibitor LprI family protein [Candidatus Udaeobacter sp.]